MSVDAVEEDRADDIRLDRDVDPGTQQPNGVAILTLDCERKFNTLTESMGKCMVRRVRELQEDHKLRAVVLTGAGTPRDVGQGAPTL